MPIRYYSLIKNSFNSILGKIGIGLLDQAILSGTNFLIGIFLIKYTSKIGYGSFVMANSCLLLSVGVQNALITTQMTVLYPQKSKEGRKQLSNCLLTGQYILWLPAIACVLIASGLIGNKIVFITALAIGLIFLKEFYRTYFFLEFKPQTVLFIDLIYACSLLAGIMAISTVDDALLHIYAVGGIGLASLCASFAGHMKYNGRFESYSLRRQFQSVMECWKNGKWSLLGVIVTWLQNQSYIYILPLIGANGFKEIADVHSSRLLLIPVVLLCSSYERIVKPKWAYDRADNQLDRIFNNSRKIFFWTTSLIVFYTLFLYFFQEKVISILFRKEYMGSARFLFIWAGFFIFQVIRSNSSIILQVFEKFKQITLFNFISSLVTILTSVCLISGFGDIGSVYGLLFGEMILALFLFSQVRKLNG